MGGPGLAESPPMLRRVTLLLCLVPGAALAQTTTPGATTAAVASAATAPLPPAGLANRSNCADSTALSTWNIGTTITPVVANGDRWRLAVFSGSCDAANVPSAGGAATVFQDVVTNGSNTQFVTNLIPVATMASRSGVIDCAAANDVTIAICVYYIPGTGSTTAAQLASQGSFVFQLAKPPRPVITRVTPGDSQLAVSLVPGTTTSTETANTSISFSATCTPASGSGSSSTSGLSGAGTVTCGGLTNSVPYTVTALAFSRANNSSAVSDPAGPDGSTTPLPFLNFWQVYKDQGGVEQGGCSTGGVGALAPALALLGLLAVRRRRS